MQNNENNNNFIPLTEEDILAIRNDGVPAAQKFSEIFNREGHDEMIRIVQQRGVAGALILFMDELFPPHLLMGDIGTLVSIFANRCVLFGTKLDEILENIEFEGENVLQKYIEKIPPHNITIADLDKLWGTDEEENTE